MAPLNSPDDSPLDSPLDSSSTSSSTTPFTLPSGLPFAIDAVGQFSPDQLRIRWQNQPRPTSPELDAMIADAWARMSADCRRRSAMLFNGQLVRYLSHQHTGDRLEIEAGPTNYRDFVGTNLLNGQRVDEIGWDHFANPIGTTATVISSDNFLLYGRRNDRVAFHANHLHTIGGGLEDRERAADHTIDAFASIQRELHEELSIKPDEIAELTCVGLIHDRQIHQPELIFDATVTLTRAELLDRLDLDDAHQEHTAIESCPDQSDAVIPFIQSAGLIAPVAIGALFLHGHRRWGADWYNRTAETLFEH